MKVIDKYGREVDVLFIDENGCHNDGRHICNLGYACDGCPYNIGKTCIKGDNHKGSDV